MNQKLETLNHKLEELKRKKYNATKMAEYNAREMQRALQDNKPKDYEKHIGMREFYKEQSVLFDAEIQKIESQITEIQVDRAKESYLRKLRAFDEGMVLRLKDLLKDLENILNDKPFSKVTAENAYDYYVLHSRGFHVANLAPYEILGLQSVRLRYSHILEMISEIGLRSTTRGAPLGRSMWADKVVPWTTQLMNQIKDCLVTVETRSKHSKKSILSKLKEKVSNGHR